jgi:hypothetical protein
MLNILTYLEAVYELSNFRADDLNSCLNFISYFFRIFPMFGLRKALGIFRKLISL